MATMPFQGDLESSEVGRYVKKYLAGAKGIPVEARMKILRLIENMSGGGALVEAMQQHKPTTVVHTAGLIGGRVQATLRHANIVAVTDVLVHEACRRTALQDAIAGTAYEHIFEYHADTVALVASRQSEQRNAAAALGATGTVSFLGYVDGELEHSKEATERIALAIRQIKPDVVLSHDPWKRYRLHPDHRNTGLNVCDAIVAALPGLLDEIQANMLGRAEAFLAERRAFVFLHPSAVPDPARLAQFWFPQLVGYPIIDTDQGDLGQ